MFDVKYIQNKIGYTFKNNNLLKSAFIHSSYANENKEKSNERLEFLGDSVLSIIITDYIYANCKRNEGDLSKIRASLVNEQTLSFIFKQLGFQEFIFRGEGLKNILPTNAMMADAMEALIASIYLDGGLNKAKIFVLSIFESVLKETIKDGVPESNKCLLQEKYKNAKILYDTKSTGEGQDKIYVSKVFINGVACGEGSSTKKRFAEDLAAKQALTKVKKV